MKPGKVHVKVCVKKLMCVGLGVCVCVCVRGDDKVNLYLLRHFTFSRKKLVC